MIIPKVVTEEIWPPIPVREFDYRASYDGDEPDDNGNMDCGWGKTRDAAIRDLIENFPR
jgi:hypothetical protein